ncbi:MAG: hypothetical protein U0263_29480 [Polyangiaceae bacterium]
MTTETPKETRGERLGRRVALVLFGLVVSGITLTWSAEIVAQAFFPKASAAPASCREGVLQLISAVRRARRAADEETGGERAAVARFRAALSPEWDARDALGPACGADARLEHALREVDRLRYAEEHATRYEAVDLARRRREVLTLERELTRR